MNIILDNSILDNFPLENHEYLVDPEYYESKSGVNEYRLYSYLSQFFNDCVILDIGTLTGRSAVSLSYNPKNKVISYDVIDHIRNPWHKIYTKPNIEFRIKNVLEDLTPELVSKCKIIVIDIDHREVIEKQILDRLRELKFSGIILLDDIKHPSVELYILMQNLWNNIPEKKYDISKYGHFSGTGLVLMNIDINIILGIPNLN